jgi:hypothetical protein
MLCAHRRKTRHNRDKGFSNCPHYNQFSDRFGRGVCDRIISHSLWPARLPDLTPKLFYLWCNLKDKVYRMNPHLEEELKENIQREIWKFLKKNFFG